MGKLVQFFWPGNSPDLNVIENAWSTLKDAISKLKTPPRTQEGLKKILIKKWKEDAENGKHLRLIRSFEKRMIKLKKLNYGKIKYCKLRIEPYI